MLMSISSKKYGQGDSSYQAANKLPGITKLCEDFYHYMDLHPEARVIREMHPKDLTQSIEKLAFFISGWLNGPRIYQKNMV